MTIQTMTLNEMLDIIAGLVSRGLTFKADTATLKITLTGGF